MRHKPWSGCGGPGVSAAERPRRAGAWAGLIRACPTCGFVNDAASTPPSLASRRGAARGALGGSGACGSDPERRGRGCPRRTDEVRLAWEELTRVPRLRFSFELEASTPPSLASRRGAARGALGGSGACGSDPERRGRGCPRRTDEVRLAWEELTRVPRLRFSFELESAAVETDGRAPAAPRGIRGNRDPRHRWSPAGSATGTMAGPWNRRGRHMAVRRTLRVTA